MSKIEDYLYENMGRVYWKKAKGSRGVVGNRFGSYSGRYWHGMFDGKMYKEHQLVFYLNRGYIPKNIDHINGDCLDNRIENLREATSVENGRNAKLRKDSGTGHKNVIFDKERSMYRVEFKHQNKTVFMKRFDDLELACLVADEYRSKFHGQFARNQ